MNKNVRILSALFLIVAYYIVGSSACFSLSSNTKYENGKQHFLNEKSNIPPYHFAALESPILGLQNSTFSNLKIKTLNNICAISSLKTTLLDASFSKSKLSTRNSLINNKKTDIFFPFHSFW